MDFTFTEEQETIAKVARQLFEHRVTPERLTELEAGDVRYDPALWSGARDGRPPRNCVARGRRRQRSWLPRIGVAARRSGVERRAGAGLRHPCPRGRSNRPARQRTSAQRHLPDVVNGNRLLTAALAEPGRSDPTAPATTAHRDRDGWRIDGSKELVPAAQVAHTMLIPAPSTTATSGCSSST